jgi:hypothetical protein
MDSLPLISGWEGDENNRGEPNLRQSMLGGVDGHQRLDRWRGDWCGATSPQGALGGIGGHSEMGGWRGDWVEWFFLPVSSQA